MNTLTCSDQFTTVNTFLFLIGNSFCIDKPFLCTGTSKIVIFVVFIWCSTYRLIPNSQDRISFHMKLHSNFYDIDTQFCYAFYTCDRVLLWQTQWWDFYGKELVSTFLRFVLPDVVIIVSWSANLSMNIIMPFLE